MNLFVLRAELVNPPSEIGAIRTVGLMAAVLNLEPLIEIDEENQDIYWSFFKQHYLTDYFKEIVHPKEVSKAIRVEFDVSSPWSIAVDRITFNNQPFIIGQLQRLDKTMKLLA